MAPKGARYAGPEADSFEEEENIASWHEVDQNAVAKKSLALIDLKAAKTADGLETVANEILKATDNRVSDATEPSSSLVDQVFKKNFSSKLAILTDVLAENGPY